jgi:MFS family permease
MADPTPLLSQTNNTAPCDTTTQTNEHLPSLGSTIEKCIGEFNWSQLLQALLVSFAWIFDAQQTFITVFTDAMPSWHCTGEYQNLNQIADVRSNLQFGPTVNISNDCYSATSFNDMCNLPKGSWAWDGPAQASMISEWALECENSIITGLPASMFFVGCLVGGLFLSTLADSSSLGRKNMLFYSTLLMALSSFLTTFSPNIWIYSSLKFLTGFSRATIGTSSLVLASELVGKRWRGKISVIGFFCFTIGFLSLPAIAYVNKASSWRNLYLMTSVPTLFYCMLVKIFVQESPRWLLVRGQKEEAIATLKYITSITQSNLNLAINNLSSHEEENNLNVDLFYALKILLQEKWSSRRLLFVMAIGFGVGVVYYGMPLGLGNLSFNLYLSVTFNALSELPSSLVIFFFIDKFRRRIALLVFCIISGVFSVMSTMEGEIWSKMQIWFELISFFSACTSFGIYLIFTTELFPTCVRNSALSMARLAVVFGGVFSPLLVGAGREYKFLCYGVFGLAIAFSGVFGVFLPETKGRALCDTMDEEESKGKVSCDILA